MSTPSAWDPDPIGLVTHEGHESAAGVKPLVVRHDFDGQTALGTWVISFTATGMNTNDAVSLTFDT